MRCKKNFLKQATSQKYTILPNYLLKASNYWPDVVIDKGIRVIFFLERKILNENYVIQIELPCLQKAKGVFSF